MASWRKEADHRDKSATETKAEDHHLRERSSPDQRLVEGMPVHNDLSVQAVQNWPRGEFHATTT
eukprot:CAMPEP_0180682654 /NCGR_PEP_ID=MMETSP1037_2-20121125/70678_1 /TAXON_ID=632150 /ORGANISM="Azadinium spinosum, Strain 3D9" /LENGTH=63 /DNA_ID=CAMNT_0022712673 /DNA_START=298 /DNA_END=485 /DNA_ORIENTATION=+